MYEKFYNFSGSPFRLNPDPSFFFNSKTHKRALAYLRYGIEQGEGFIIITGDVGTGKTTLVSRLFQTLNTSNFVVAKIVNSQLRAEDLLRMVAAEYGLDYKRPNKATILKNIENFFIKAAEEGKRVLLVIDEAQNLAPKALEELRMLSNIQYEGRQILQSFLLGQKEFREIMRMNGLEQLRQRVIASYHLRPLDLEETRSYILHRLQIVGWHERPKIDEEVFSEIHKYSNGIPRKTNLLCDRILLYSGLEQLETVDYHAFQGVLNDIEDEFWNNDLAVDINFDKEIEFKSTNEGSNSPHPTQDYSELDNRLIQIQSNILSLDNNLKTLNEVVQSELKDIRRVLNKSKD